MTNFYPVNIHSTVGHVLSMTYIDVDDIQSMNEVMIATPGKQGQLEFAYTAIQFKHPRIINVNERMIDIAGFANSSPELDPDESELLEGMLGSLYVTAKDGNERAVIRGLCIKLGLKFFGPSNG